MFGILKNLQGHRYLWTVALVAGGLLGVGMTANQAQAAEYRGPTYVGGTASAAQINANLQRSIGNQAARTYDRMYNYPWSAVNPYSPYNPYSPNYIANPRYYPYVPYYPSYSPYYPLYNPAPNVVYPYVSPYGIGSTTYPYSTYGQ